MKVPLNQIEVDLLLKAVEIDSSPETFLKFITSHKNGKYTLEATEDDFIKWRDQCMDYLLMVGFDKDYNPTKEGEILEDLIDKLYTG